MCELRSTDSGIINQSSQFEQRGTPFWTIQYGSSHNPPCINHALMHSSSGLCQILNINESIILCQEMTVGTAAHSWTGTRSSVDLSRRCIHLKENPVMESVGEAIMGCATQLNTCLFFITKLQRMKSQLKRSRHFLIRCTAERRKPISTLLNYTCYDHTSAECGTDQFFGRQCEKSQSDIF